MTGNYGGLLPAQDSGRALASLLYGEAPPSGCLPYGIPYDTDDLSSLLFLASRPETAPIVDLSELSELDYKDSRPGIRPRYPVGYG